MATQYNYGVFFCASPFSIFNVTVLTVIGAKSKSKLSGAAHRAIGAKLDLEKKLAPSAAGAREKNSAVQQQVEDWTNQVENDLGYDGDLIAMDAEAPFAQAAKAAERPTY